jgi:ribosomal protein S18 acetylase RimI-like enzyme
MPADRDSPATSMGLTIRDGRDADLAALTGIEARSFASDRLSRRSLRRFLAADTARIRVALSGGAAVGYHLLLLRQGSAIARLYSIAVDRTARGAGLGGRLLADAERLARRLKRTALRLEVRADNRPAIRLYERQGYWRIGRYRQYYADKTDALRYEKRLGPGGDGRRTPGSDEDRSPADFGVSNPPMKRSRQASTPEGARAPFPVARRRPVPSRRPQRGREA